MDFPGPVRIVFEELASHGWNAEQQQHEHADPKLHEENHEWRAKYSLEPQRLDARSAAGSKMRRRAAEKHQDGEGVPILRRDQHDGSEDVNHADDQANLAQTNSQD